jgi:acyl-CoA dehydrogenase
VQMAKVYHDIVQRAIQLHGSLGVTLETPLANMWMSLPSLALADGPTEVHLAQVAKAYLKNTKPSAGLFPSDHGPSRLAAVQKGAT